MKTIIITKDYRNTIRGFLEWFQNEYETNDRESQVVIERLTHKLDITEASKEPFEIYELEIWFLRNYLQSAWQYDSCTVNKEDLHKLFDYIVENDNEQTNS